MSNKLESRIRLEIQNLGEQQTELIDEYSDLPFLHGTPESANSYIVDKKRRFKEAFEAAKASGSWRFGPDNAITWFTTLTYRLPNDTLVEVPACGTTKKEARLA